MPSKTASVAIVSASETINPRNSEIIWLKMYIKFGSQSVKQKSDIYKNINKYKKHFIESDVVFVCNKDSKKNINLSIGFEN